MTTTEIQTKKYERLDGYIDKIVGQLQTAAELMQEYFNAAKEEGISEEEAKKYLKSKIPHSTYYKYLPAEITKRKYTVDNSLTEESSSSEHQFDTKGMGVVPDDDEPEVESSSASSSATGKDGNEVEQEIEQPMTVESLEEIDNEDPEFGERLDNSELRDRIKEFKEEIQELTKALEEARRDNKVLVAANPDLSRWTDREKNLSNEVKKLLDENKTLRENQKPVVFNKASEMTSVTYVTAEHKDLPDIDKLVHRCIRDGANIRFTVENNKIIGHEVINFATQTQQE